MKKVTGSKRKLTILIIILLIMVGCPVCVYGEALDFTQAEAEYIRNSEPIRVCLNTNRAPFSEYDESTGEFSGICVDILNEISRESGLEFEFVEQQLDKTTPELFESGGFDIICGVERDNFFDNDDIVATDSFLESSVVPVGLAGTTFDLNKNTVVGVTSSFQALIKAVERDYPNLTVKKYKTNRDGLDAVANGEVDAFIQNTHIIGLLIQEPQYEGFDILPIEVMEEHTAMAMGTDENPLLLSIMNKSIDNIDEALITSSLIEYTFGNQYDYTLWDFLYKFRVQIIII